MRDNLKDFVNANREEFDQREPSADLWNKIRPQVVPQVSESKIRPLWKWASIAAATLLVGTVTFIAFEQSDRQDQQEKVELTNGVNKKDRLRAIAPEVRDLPAESTKPLLSVKTIASHDVKVKRFGKKPAINDLEGKYMVENSKPDYVQMLQDSSSASTRLSGVLALKNVGSLDQKSFGALEHAAVSDQNSNVRIAAIETILNGLSPEARQQKVQDFFVAQSDPTVQMELMQLMAQQDEPTIKATTKDKLNQIVEDPFTLKFVKEQAYAVLLNQ